MQIIRDLTVSGGSSELIDKLSTLQNQYSKRSELPSTQQFKALKMGEETPPAHTVPVKSISEASLPDLPPSDLAQEQQLEDAYRGYEETLRRITRPGGAESLTQEQKDAAVKIAEGKL